MIFKGIFSAVFMFVLLLGASPKFAQGPSPETSRRVSAFSGEVLTYEGKVDKILRGISVAELTLRTEGVPNSDEFVIKTDAVSKGTLLRIFRYSFLQQYESTLDPSMRILKTKKHDVQKQRVRNSEAIFDYAGGRVTYVENDPKDSTRPPRTIASSLGSEMLDMVSAIYYVRTLPLAVNKRFELSVSDSGLIYEVPIVVTAREFQKTIFGRIPCFRVEAEIFGPGRLIEQKGRMTIWFADNALRIPVRSQIQTEFGKFEVRLKSTNGKI